MTNEFDAKWVIVPDKTPRVIRRCRNCNRKTAFYCSEKFRVNGNHGKLDVWLIYKCEKCDNTWKLTIKKGVRPHDIPGEIFDGFVNNDKALAWRYAFDRQLLRSGECEVNYDSIGYRVDGASRLNLSPGKSEANHELTAENSRSAKANENFRVLVESPHPFDLKLSAFIAAGLGISAGAVKKLAEQGAVATEPESQIMKYKIKSGFVLNFTRSASFELPLQFLF